MKCKRKGQASQPWRLVFAAKFSAMTSMATQCTARWAEMHTLALKPFWNLNATQITETLSETMSVSKKCFNIQQGFGVFCRIEVMIKIWLVFMPGISFDVEVRGFYLFICCRFIYLFILRSWFYGWGIS